MSTITIIGAGLAGAEAAWQAALAGCQVTLYEMRPCKSTPAHQTAYFAELVCSNSLRADGLANAVGLLKEEMRRQNSLIMACADAHRVPAGVALAVDREGFAQAVTERLQQNPSIQIMREEVCQIPPEGIVIIAAGPLVSDSLARAIATKTGGFLHFHDAVAPIVAASSIDRSIVYAASRYGKGESVAGDYLNCPMERDEYLRFYQALLEGERLPLRDFETEKDFEGCMPIESMARRGVDTMRYGPLKPVGLPDPRTGQEPYAVVQLRQDDAAASMYNLVGFQTRLKWPEQKRIFSLIPGLAQAEFLRLGVMHRNTYIQSPQVLDITLALKEEPRIFFAGQITGVEGYIESAASGLAAGINAARLAQGQELLTWPVETALGGLLRYITTPTVDFQPMNVTFGLLPPLEQRIRKKREKNLLISERALTALANFQEKVKKG